MKRILIAGTALALIAAPAHAQLLGGGGLGGSIGGTLGGTLGGAGSIGSPTSGIGSVTRGTLDGAGTVNGSARADRRSGRVDASGNGNAGGSGSLGSALDTPTRSLGLDGAANGSVSGGGSASAQLIGTDAVRSTAGQAAGQARGAAQGLADTAGGLVGSAQGSASGTLAGSGSYASGPLAAAGSLAAQGNGAFAVEEGTPVFAPDGDRIGRVRQVVSDARGNVQQLLVKVDGQEAVLPANYFQASGSGLVSVMGEGQIKQIARQQEAAEEAGS